MIRRLKINCSCSPMNEANRRIKHDELLNKIHRFSSYYLEKDIENLIIKLANKIEDENPELFGKSRHKNWASALIYLIIKVNYILDSPVGLCVTSEDISEFFNTKSYTFKKLSREVAEKYNINTDNPEYSIKDAIDLKEYLVYRDGEFYIVDQGIIYPYFT